MENKQEFSVQYLQKTDLNDFSVCPASASQIMFAQAVRVLRQNLRQGTVACKGRSDVARSNKKPWKQKGTGRARAGSARSPLWKGGGVIHGPQARVAELKINKQMKQHVFSSLCNQMLENKRVLCVNWSISEDLKTRHVAMLLKQLGINMSKVLFFMNFDNIVLLRNISNIQSVRPIFFDQPDVTTLADADYWLVLQADYDVFKSMVGKWL